jgi:hypothetical protein
VRVELTGKGHSLVKKAPEVAQRLLVAYTAGSQQTEKIARALGQIAEKAFPKKDQALLYHNSELKYYMVKLLFPAGLIMHFYN